MSTHYEVLGLPAGKTLTPQLIKAAYRRALLLWHPDKNNSNTRVARSTAFSVDQIALAYQTLLSPKSRAEYDRSLALSSESAPVSKGGEIFRTGVEIVDLDDLKFEEDSKTGEMTWYRGCRCGDDKGYIIKEEDLEDASSEGELYAGCLGCSLWLKVLFDVVEEENGEGKE